MMKVWLNAGCKTNSKILNESDMTFFNDLVKEGYIEIVNKSYSIISYKTGFNKVMENFVETLEIMNGATKATTEMDYNCGYRSSK